MNKGLVLILTLVLLASMMVFPMPSAALDYNNDHDLSNVDASFIGESADDKAGHVPEWAGDLNGDGYNDILIGANGDDDGGDGAGHIYLIFGKSSGWSMDVDLSNADADWYGEAAGDGFGRQLAGVGDVNGDGYGDFIAGASGNDEAHSGAGQTYLIFGRASSWPTNTKVTDDADASFHGEVASDGAGAFLGRAGDVNGDGYFDFLIAAYNNDDGGDTAGQVYLILGKASGWSMDTDLSNADASFVGEDAEDWVGYSVNGGGDNNGDGYDDFVIGAIKDDDSVGQAGQTYLILGKSSGWSMNTDLSNADASFRGESWGDWSGYMVANTGDVNGDGYDDIHIAVCGDDANGGNSGSFATFFGKSSGWSMDVSVGNADAEYLGESAGDVLGFSVADAGDVNGDGYDDIISGASRDDDGGSNAGQTYLVLGKSSGWSTGVSISNSDASWWGENANDGNGYGLAGVGDVNGDGYDDIVTTSTDNDAGGSNAGQMYLIFPQLNKNPTAVTSVKAYSDGSYTVEISQADIDDTIYIELIGTDGQATTADIAVVKVYSDSHPTGFILRLKETGVNTGIYRGTFDIKDRTHETYRWIEAVNGDIVTVESRNDPTKKATISVGGPAVFTLRPLVDVNDTNEDEFYEVHYWATGGTVDTWTFETNASWLQWNATSHNISGTPDNTDVGSYWVRINISDGDGNYSEHNFTLTVHNVPPQITTSDVTVTDEDDPYLVTYSSDDDPSTTWTSSTNASWLNFDPPTQVLSGTPDNGDVGSFWVNISLDDGNGGTDHTNFTLDVLNIEPTITTTDVTTTPEDVPYARDYDSTDDGTGTVSWSLDTNASFLSIGSTTGQLSGTPDNADVNSYYVNVSVDDGNGGSNYTNFSLVVTNVAPIITNGDQISTMEDVLYQVDYDSTDDGAGTITWALWTDADFLSINASSGILNGTPDNGDVGEWIINTTVDDGNGGIDFTNFTLTVTNVGPVILTSDLSSAIEDALYTVDYNSSEDGAGNVTWYLDTDADFLSIDPATGVLSGTPDNTDIWTYYVNVTVNDGNGAIAFTNFSLTVTNVDPEITTFDDPTAREDTLYETVYHSTDDGQGTIIWLLDTNASWLSIDQFAGVLNGTPDNTHVGWYWVNVSVNDGNGGIGYSNFTLTVENVDPEIITTPLSEVYEDSEYQDDLDCTDDGMGAIGWTIYSGPSWLQINSSTGVINGTPTNDDVGVHTVIVWVDDGNGGIGSLQYSLRVINTNDDPVITSTPVENAEVNVGYVYDVNATDVDLGDVLTYSLGSQIEGMTIDEDDGKILWTPTRAHIGNNTVLVVVSDGQVNITQEFTVTVMNNGVGNIAPRVTLSSPLDGSTLDLTNPTLVWSGEDEEGDDIQYTVHLSLVMADVTDLEASSSIATGLTSERITPTEGLEKGKTYYWTVVPSDEWDIGLCLDGIWSFKVNETAIPNKEPVIESEPVREAVVGEEYRYQVKAKDDDTDDVLTYALEERPEGMVIDEDLGVMLWTPRDGQEGDHSVKVVVSDGKASIEQSFKITVSKVPMINNPPVITPIPDRTIKVGDDFLFQVAASDIDKDDLQYSLEGQPAGMGIGASGLIEWVPSKAQVGEHLVTVKVSDGKDNTTAQFTVTVEKVSDGTTTDGLEGTMFPALLLVIIGVVVLIGLLIARRGGRRGAGLPEEDPEEEQEDGSEEEEVDEGSDEHPDEEDTSEEAEEEEEEEGEEEEVGAKEASDQMEAELEDEIDLDDLEDED